MNDELFEALGKLGFTGSMNDRMFKKLRSDGYTGSLPDMLSQAEGGKSWKEEWVGNLPLLSLIDSLYGNSEAGAFYIPQPVVLGEQVLFQDAAGTVPVTADGDPVGLMLDVSGNGNDASQAISSARGLFEGSSGNLGVIGDGVDDYFELSLPSMSGELTVSFAIDPDDTDGGRIWVGHSSENSKIGIVNGGWFLRLVPGGDSLSAGAASTDPHVVTVTRDSGDVARLYVDGVLEGSSSMPGIALFDNLLAATSASQFFDGRVYGVVLVESVGHREAIEAYLADLAGVALP